MKRFLLAILLLAALAVGATVVLALALPGETEGQAYNWTTVTVDAPVETTGQETSIAVDSDGDPMIAFLGGGDLSLAVCDRSVSAHGNCDEPPDWSKVTVLGYVPGAMPDETSIAVDSNGDPMIAYEYYSTLHLAICDRSASAHGNCHQTSDWTTVTVDAAGSLFGERRSLAVDANGHAMISYHDIGTKMDLKFAICDRWGSAHGNCDEPGEWSTVAVDSVGRSDGAGAAIAVDSNGDPMISYSDVRNVDLKFAICDRSGSAHGNCDQPGDWSTVTVDSEGMLAIQSTSIAVDANERVIISYDDYHWEGSDLKFAVCDRPISAHGNCDQTSDWTTVTVDAMGDIWAYTSIAVGPSGDPMISFSYHDHPINADLKFAICDRSGSAHGNCDQPGDWSTQTVDAAGDVGDWLSMAAGAAGEPMISYYYGDEQHLKFATASPPSPPPTATAPPPPTPTPPAGPTRTLQWGPGWHNETWSGSGGTAPQDVFACAAGKYAAAYRYVNGGLKRYFPDRPEISDMTPLAQYDTFLILITQPVTCLMPVAAASGATRTLQWNPGWHNEGWSGPDGATPEEVFACADGNYAAAYRFTDAGLQRYFPDQSGISNMGPLNEYDAFLILATTPVSCAMAIAP